MSTGYGVDPVVVKAHATVLKNQIMDRVKLAADAAGQVKFGDRSVYGVLLSTFMPDIVEACTGDAADAIKKMGELGDGIAKNVDAVAANYATTEKDLRDMMERIMTR
ncbi:hypothetical protein Afil01_15930 [Actinorhabdospora filicis]|uniref:Excreted virulence factor EspC, type VII ESX diderm n=1 Tax=Actinorhabdospora filicis TaxID=1785913 RepID=A0A9W6SJI8_9ACTN|nr:hypothetical protein [Actinorhabdospora filicis]GLZ76786.1 hypothetical protein Afil01_15930 [Actinorhabdospora filicis]